MENKKSAANKTVRYCVELYKRLSDNPDDPGYDRYGEPRQVKDIFDDLVKYLSVKNMLPDEYFNLDFRLNSCQMPDFLKMLVNVDYGGSEGIYIDVDLVVMDEESLTRNEVHFITAKTLDASNESMDRMHMIASEIRKVFNGRGFLPDEGLLN